MENQSSNNVEIALIKHRLIDCKAETQKKLDTKSGGSLVFSYQIQTPESPETLNKGESFPIAIFIDIKGMLKDTDETAFQVSCGMEGYFEIINCHEDGIQNNTGLWKIAAGQLSPVLSQFASELILRMGFSNIHIPPYISGMFEAETKKKRNGKKKTKLTDTTVNTKKKQAA